MALQIGSKLRGQLNIFSKAHFHSVDLFPISFISLYPILIALANSTFLVNKSDIDVWFYSGYFSYFDDFSKENSPSFASTYYGTRMPYILFGRPFFLLFGENLGHLLLAFSSFYLISFTLYATVRRLINKNAAFVGILFLLIDPFFLRMIGSDYVDRGVVVFFTLSIYFLSKIWESRSSLYLMIAGFFLASTLYTHLVSVLLLPFYFAFFYHLVVLHNLSKLALFRFFARMSVGIMLATIIYQFAYFLFSNKGSFFLLPQLLIRNQTKPQDYSLSIAALKILGFWNIIPTLAVLLCAMFLVQYLLIPAQRQGKQHLSQLLLVLSFPATLLVLLLISFPTAKMLASRDGLYTSFFYPVIVIVVSIFVGSTMEKRTRALIWLSTFIGILNIVKFANLTEFQIWIHSNGPTAFQTLVITGSASILITTLTPRIPWLSLFIPAVLIIGFVNWNFNGDSTVYKNNSLISKISMPKLPYFFYDKSIPGGVEFDSLVGSFTEKAWWKTGLKYPDCQQLVGGEQVDSESLVILFIRDLSDKISYNNFTECIGSKAKPKVYNLEDKFGKFEMHMFVSSKNRENLSLVFTADSLPGIVGTLISGDRIARQDIDEKGVLSFGPYISLPKGRYRVTFEYKSETSINSWIVQSGYRGLVSTLSTGNLEGTNRKWRKEEVFVEIPNSPEARYQFLTFYEGEGELSISKIEIFKID